MTIPQLFGAHILTLRAAHGLTQQELADRLHVKRANLSRVEQHGTDPLLSSLSKYAAALRLPIQELIPPELRPSKLLIADADTTVAVNTVTGRRRRFTIPT